MMQMWNLHSRVPAGQPACLCVCQPAAWAAWHNRCPGPCLELGSSETPHCCGHFPKEGPGVHMREGPRQGLGRPILAGQRVCVWGGPILLDPSCLPRFLPEICLVLCLRRAFLASWLEDPRSQMWEEQMDTNQSSFLFIWLHLDPFQSRFHSVQLL